MIRKEVKMNEKAGSEPPAIPHSIRPRRLNTVSHFGTEDEKRTVLTDIDHKNLYVDYRVKILPSFSAGVRKEKVRVRLFNGK